MQIIRAVVWYPFYLLLLIAATTSEPVSAGAHTSVYKIEGKVIFPAGTDALHQTRILVNEGEYVGIPHVDGSFVIAGIPSGSHLVSVNSPSYIFESVRVEINNNGRIRARKVNVINPREVILMKYPLHFETCIVPDYFQKRIGFNLIDFIMSPSFVALIVPVALLIFLPKLVLQGPDADQAFQQANGFLQPQYNLPDFTDILIQLFGGVQRRRPPRNPQQPVRNQAPLPNTQNRQSLPQSEQTVHNEPASAKKQNKSKEKRRK